MYILMLSIGQNIWGLMGFTLTLHKSCNKKKPSPIGPSCPWDAGGPQTPLVSRCQHSAAHTIARAPSKTPACQRFQGMRYILDGLEKRDVYTDARHLPGFFSSEQDNDVQKKWGLQNATFLKERWLKFFMTSWQLSEPPNLAPPKSPVVDWVLGFQRTWQQKSKNKLLSKQDGSRSS